MTPLRSVAEGSQRDSPGWNEPPSCGNPSTRESDPLKTREELLEFGHVRVDSLSPAEVRRIVEQ
eukprot:12893058-Prorocentrum_lima.AAC.1